MIRGIHHAAISTPDMKRALDFYAGLLGFEVTLDVELEDHAALNEITALHAAKTRIVMIELAGQRIELFQYAEPEPEVRDPDRRVCDHGITHLCLEVTDIDSEYERLKAAGMSFNCPPVRIGNLRATYGRDPDGNVVELLEEPAAGSGA